MLRTRWQRAVGLGALLAVLGAAGCSDSGEEVALDGPCGLLREADASELFGAEVAEVGFVEFAESEGERIPDEDIPMVDAAAGQHCIYRAVGGDAAIIVQLNFGRFPDIETFRSAWGDDVEILDTPGLAATYSRPSEEPRIDGAVSVLVNDEGDNFGLTAYQSGISRGQLLELATTLTGRYDN